MADPVCFNPLPSQPFRWALLIGGAGDDRAAFPGMELDPPWGLADPATILARHGQGELAAARFAAVQHCLITTEQLRFLGLEKEAVARRVRRGMLRRLHRGVYLVGPAPITDVGRLAAAVLACGPRAVLSHRAAALLWDLLPLNPRPVDVSLVGIRRPSRPGIKTHYAKYRSDLRHRELIPVTSPALTPPGRRGRGERARAGVGPQQRQASEAGPSRRS